MYRSAMWMYCLSSIAAFAFQLCGFCLVHCSVCFSGYVSSQRRRDVGRTGDINTREFSRVRDAFLSSVRSDVNIQGFGFFASNEFGILCLHRLASCWASLRFPSTNFPLPVPMLFRCGRCPFYLFFILMSCRF